MTPPANPFDQACRYLAKLDPEGFLGWALGLPTGRFRFVRWMDTRQIPFPGEPDRVCDTVAFLEDVSAGGAPLAVPIEFSAEPDYRMFGRLLIYAGSLWLEVRPASNKGDRFQLGVAVVNLTGTGRSSRDMRWPEAGLVTELRVAERNLAGESATAVLSGVTIGTTSRVILPFVPLMQGGAEAGIIQGWLGLASAE